MARVLLFKRKGIENVYTYVTRMNDKHVIPRDTDRLFFCEGKTDGDVNDTYIPHKIILENRLLEPHKGNTGEFIPV